MRTRYYCDLKGNPARRALILEQDDHKIDRHSLHPDSIAICRRLSVHGFQAYIVGGAVRDLLLKKTPKDFDIATRATPSQVKKIFRNSRIIGKRFRLVHVYFGADAVYEVATFRALESRDREHRYGTLCEDVMRRDFTCNSLYYDPVEQTIIDLTGGYSDIRKHRLLSVQPIEPSFREDPVRMLRAIKYSALSDLKIPGSLSAQIKNLATLLSSVSLSRLSEELNKILGSGKSAQIFSLLRKHQLLQPFLPEFHSLLQQQPAAFMKTWFRGLEDLDSLQESGQSGKGQMIRNLTEPFLVVSGIFDIYKQPVPAGTDNPVHERYTQVMGSLKAILRPLVQPNRDIEEATRQMLLSRHLPLPSRKSMKKQGYNRKKKVRTPQEQPVA